MLGLSAVVVGGGFDGCHWGFATGLVGFGMALSDGLATLSAWL